MRTNTRKELHFLIIGAQKAGTTSLHEYLRHHPDVFLPLEKECPFFSHDRIYAKGWEAYFEEYFGAPADGVLLGTATPHYMWGAPHQRLDDEGLDSPEWIIPRRIRLQLPDVKLIALLRDPVERCISQFRMQCLNGLEKREMNTALTELLDPDALELSRHAPTRTNTYVVLGEYGRILAPYFKLFGKQQLLIVFSAHLAQHPRAVLQRVLKFIGVDSTFVPPNLGRRYRVGSTQRLLDVNPHSVPRRMSRNPVVHGAWARLPPSARSSLRRAYFRWMYRFALWNRRPQTASVELSPGVRRQLDAVYVADADRLQSLIGQPPIWTEDSPHLLSREDRPTPVAESR